MENKISVVLTNESYNSILQQIDEMGNSMPFLINLSENERQGGFRLGDKNLGFLEKGKDYIAQHPEFLPAFQSADEIGKDAVLTAQLSTIARKLNILADTIEDTASIAGLEALSGILAYYNAVKLAAKNNANGARTIYDDLSSRFPGKAKANTQDKV